MSRDSFFGGTVEKCNKELEYIDKLRIEYSTYEPKRLRYQIMRWLDYFEREVAKDKRDCETQKTRKEMDEYYAKNKVKDARVSELHEKLRNLK